MGRDALHGLAVSAIAEEDFRRSESLRTNALRSHQVDHQLVARLMCKLGPGGLTGSTAPGFAPRTVVHGVETELVV